MIRKVRRKEPSRKRQTSMTVNTAMMIEEFDCEESKMIVNESFKQNTQLEHCSSMNESFSSSSSDFNGRGRHPRSLRVDDFDLLDGNESKDDKQGLQMSSINEGATSTRRDTSRDDSASREDSVGRFV